MICQLCEFDMVGARDTATVAVKDCNGNMNYVCEFHAKEIHNENIKCYNCGSTRNEIHDSFYEYGHDCEHGIRCEKCKTEIGYYAYGVYEKYKSREDYEKLNHLYLNTIIKKINFKGCKYENKN